MEPLGLRAVGWKVQRRGQETGEAAHLTIPSRLRLVWSKPTSPMLLNCIAHPSRQLLWVQRGMWALKLLWVQPPCVRNGALTPSRDPPHY